MSIITNIIDELLTHSCVSPEELQAVYSNVSSDYERKFISLINRISDRFSLEYGDDYEIISDDRFLAVVLKKYYSQDPIAISVICNKKEPDRLFEIIDEAENIIVYNNPLYIEQFLMDYYKR